MNHDYVKTFEYLEENCKAEASDVYYALEFLVESIRRTKSAISKTIQLNPTDFDKISEISKYGKNAEEIEKILNEYLDSFAVGNIELSEPIGDEDEEDDIKIKKIIPNYHDYDVNQKIPHLLTENFTFKKACGFMFEEIRYDVKNWKDLLAQLCEILIKKDQNIFDDYANSIQARGHKVAYFSKSNNGNDYYYKIKNSQWYVWTNRSVNAICSTIRSLLAAYSISINSLYIYLRADYTALHIENDNGEKIVPDNSESN